jgi:hypothetical protein
LVGSDAKIEDGFIKVPVASVASDTIACRRDISADVRPVVSANQDPPNPLRFNFLIGG